MENKKLITSAVAAITGLFPRSGLTEDSVRLYVELLSDLDGEGVLFAVKRCLQTAKFPPTVAEIREAYFDLDSGSLPLEGEAWAEVKQQISITGRYRQPKFSDPLILGAVEAMGGWDAICNSDNEGMTRAHFLKCYQAAAAREGLDRVCETAIVPRSVKLAALGPAENPRSLPLAPVDPSEGNLGRDEVKKALAAVTAALTRSKPKAKV